MRCRFYIFLTIIYSSVNYLYSQTNDVEAVFNPKTYNNSYVSDSESLIDSLSVIHLNDMCLNIDTSFNVQLSIVVLSSIGDNSPITFATDIGNLWRVGEDDRGLVLLLVIDDRKIAMAVGENLELLISDRTSKKIQDKFILPYLKKGEYGKGLISGVKNIRSKIDVPKKEQTNEHISTFKIRKAKSLQELIFMRTMILLVMGMLFAFNISTFLKVTVFRTMSISLMFGALCTLISFGLSWIELSNSNVVEGNNNMIGFGVVPLYLFSLYRVYEKKMIWQSIFVGAVFLLFSPIFIAYFSFLSDLSHGFTIGVSDGSFLSMFLIVGLVILTFLSLIFLGIVVPIFKKRDPFVRYQLVLKIHKIKSIIPQVILPFPILTLQMFRDHYLEFYRRHPRYSASTGLLMRLAEEDGEDQFLSPVQIAEEKAKSSDYDVWFSDEEGDVLVLQYKIKSYNQGYCDSCKQKTNKQVYSKVNKIATYESKGEIEVKMECYNCQFEKIVKKIIPKKIKVSRSSNSNTFSHNSSFTRSKSRTKSKSSNFGSSNFPSHSSSSSSSGSSGGSWGGGSFGGGGSQSSW